MRAVRFSVSGMFRHSAISSGGGVLLALVTWNLGNFLFFVIAGRLLGPTDYGLVAALLAATMIVMVPASALQYAVARGDGGLVALSDAHVGAVYRQALGRSLWMVPLAGAVVAGMILALPVADLPRGEMIVTVLIVLPMAPLYLALGQLQAEQRFGPFSVATAAIGVPRPVILLLFTALGMGVYAALGASAVALAAAAGIGVWFARPQTVRPRPTSEAWGAFRCALPPLVAGLIALSLLTNLDVMVGKLVLPAQQAGEFAAIAALGKAAVVIPQAVSIVMLPRVAARRAQNLDTGPLLAGAIGLTFIVGAAATLVAWSIETPIIRLTYGADYVDGAHLLAPLVGASTLLGGLMVLLNHHIGRNADSFVWGLTGVAALEAVLLGIFHATPEQIVMVDAVACATGLLLHEVVMGRGPDSMTAGLARLIRTRRRQSPESR
ncbi:MAG TPA: hypothetical protein PKC22_07505 [Rhodocyclaceae bacterium]|nr:hypothetical protein [Rhodocyclaceae bacterium]